MRDRKRGCLLGLAVGDALGAAVEFSPPGSFPKVTGYRGGGPHGLGPGEWTDDTSLALALAASIGAKGWDLADQLDRYAAWRTRGEYSVNGRCFDIGMTTAEALRRWARKRDPGAAGLTDARASGNGSIMRLAPVPIRYVDLLSGRPAELAHLCDESGLTTHASPACRTACRWLGLALAGLLQGLPRDTVLRADWEPWTHACAMAAPAAEVAEVIAGSYRRKRPPQIRGSGYVVHSLEAALWAFHDAEDFQEAVLRAVNLGDDADTTGTVAGQLAGACWGESGIPEVWRTGLTKRAMIEEALAGLGCGEQNRAARRPRRSARTNENPR